jgi:hypothetical protein
MIYTESDHVYIRIRVEGRDIEQLVLLANPQSAGYASSIISAHAKNLKSDMEIREPEPAILECAISKPDTKPVPVTVDYVETVAKKPRGFQKKVK